MRILARPRRGKSPPSGIGYDSDPEKSMPIHPPSDEVGACSRICGALLHDQMSIDPNDEWTEKSSHHYRAPRLGVGTPRRNVGRGFGRALALVSIPRDW